MAYGCGTASIRRVLTFILPDRCTCSVPESSDALLEEFIAPPMDRLNFLFL
jgi:hypothetical protein